MKPTEFTEELAQAICDRVSDGEMLTTICTEDAMPTRLRFYRWMKDRPELKNDYARARLAWADAWAERVMTISLNPDKADFPGKSFDPDGKVYIDNGLMMWTKHLTDNIKFMVGKYAPRSYGDARQLDDELPKPEVTEIRRIIIGWQKPDAQQEAQPPSPPRQITYTPPAPAGLSPEAWALMLDVLNLIEAHTPTDSEETPERVLTAIKDALIALSVH